MKEFCRTKNQVIRWQVLRIIRVPASASCKPASQWVASHQVNNLLGCDSA